MPPPMGIRGGGFGGGGGSRLGLPSSGYNRRASTCSGNMFGPTVPAPHKKRSIPNLDNKRGSNASGSGIYGLVINPKITKVS